MTRFASRSLVLGLVAAAGFGCSAILPPGFGQASPAPEAAASAPSFKGQVTGVLKSQCASCHSAGGGGARALQIFDADGHADYEVSKARMGDMIAAIKSGRMPLGRPNSVPADQLKTLEDWHAAGGPNN